MYIALDKTLYTHHTLVVSLIVGRQNTAWKTFGYIPTDWVDPSGSTGLPTREASRALEYAVNDFAVHHAAITLNKSTSDIAKYANRSMNFLNHWDASVTSDGFSGFSQRRYPVEFFQVALKASLA
jgi:putative alpha-1,2-mannosidase